MAHIQIALKKEHGSWRSWRDWFSIQRWLAFLIRLRTRGPYSHAEILLERGGTSLAFSASWVDNPRGWLGVTAGPRWTSWWRLRDAADWSIWEVDCTQAQLTHVIRLADSLKTASYDVCGLIGFGLGIPQLQREEAWYCSELVSYLFREAGIYDFEEQISPNGLLRDVSQSTMWRQVYLPR